MGIRTHGLRAPPAQTREGESNVVLRHWEGMGHLYLGEGKLEGGGGDKSGRGKEKGRGVNQGRKKGKPESLVLKTHTIN